MGIDHIEDPQKGVLGRSRRLHRSDKVQKGVCLGVVGDAGGHVLVRVVRPDRDSLDEKETKTDTSEEITWVRKI